MMNIRPELQTLVELNDCLQLDCIPKSIDLPIYKDLLTIAPDKIYLRFAQVLGRGAPPIFDIYINAYTVEEYNEGHFAGAIAPYGLVSASRNANYNPKYGHYYNFEIGALLEQLTTQVSWKSDTLKITFVPHWFVCSSTIVIHQILLLAN